MRRQTLANESWAQISAYFADLRKALGGSELAPALIGIEDVAHSIAEAPANLGLFGWTSMHDLCIQQADVAPYSGPFLRLSPHPGAVEFRYVDTAIVNRQWNRSVSPEKAIERFRAFLDQARWLG